MKTNSLFAAFFALSFGCVDSTKEDTGSSESEWDAPAADVDGEDPGDVDGLGDDDGSSTGDDDGSSTGDDDGSADTDADADDGTDDTGDTPDADADDDDDDLSDSDGDGFTTADGDCNDDDASIYPGAVEICNEVDDDCDDEIDEVEEGTIFTWYADVDGDGFGSAEMGTIENEECVAPEGYSSADGDCDDYDFMVYPGAVEQCDYVDNDCNGLVDEDDPDVVLETWYLDSDRDGYGDDATAVEACFPPDEHIAVGGDLDDSDPSVRGDPLWMARFVIEVTWNVEGDDMDLHLLAPGGSLTDSATDCYYLTCKESSFERIDWGVVGETSDDPTLNMDDISGTGPEVISLPEPAPGTYTVVVHDYGFSPSEFEEGTEVSVRIFLDGVLEVSDTRVITGEGVYQAFAEIVVSEDSEAPLEVNTLDEVMTVGDSAGTTGGDTGSIFDTDGGSDDGGSEDGSATDDGGSDVGGSDDGSTTDDGGSDDGSTADDGGSDDGGSDDGGSDDEAATDDGGSDDGDTTGGSDADDGGDGDDSGDGDDAVTDEPAASTTAG